MHNSSVPLSEPLTLDRSTESTVYALFSVAMGLTAVGVYTGFLFAETLFSSGILMALVIAELGIIFTSRMWMNAKPWNVILFGAFPLLSGITIAPYILSVLVGYSNGASIVLNALIGTVCMSLGAALFARTTSMNLTVFGRTLFFTLIGFVILSIVRFFVPALQTTAWELGISGFGILLFAAFTAYDVQRIQVLARQGFSPFMLALSLYLDIFNLFLMILRFMVALSGRD